MADVIARKLAGPLLQRRIAFPYRVVLEKAQVNYRPSWYDGIALWGNYAKNIMRSLDHGDTWHVYKAFDDVYPGRVRTTASGAVIAWCTDTGNGLISIRREDPATKEWEEVHSATPTTRGSMPNSITVLPSGTILWGEYSTASVAAVPDCKLWRGTDDGTVWTAVQTWPRTGAGAIRHIHAIQYDPYDSNKVYIASGDSHPEVHIWYTTDEGDSLVEVGGGSPTWRTCSFVFTPQFIHWPSDADRSPWPFWRLLRGTQTPEKTGESATWVYFASLLAGSPSVAPHMVAWGRQPSAANTGKVLKLDIGGYISVDQTTWQQVDTRVATVNPSVEKGFEIVPGATPPDFVQFVSLNYTDGHGTGFGRLRFVPV